MRYSILVITLLLLAGCDSQTSGRDSVATQEAVNLSENWRIEIQLPDTVLPVQLHLANDFTEAWFVNGVERVVVPEINRDGSHLQLRFPSFNNTFDLELSGNSLAGELTLVKRGYEQVMPVSGVRGVPYRFSETPEPAVDVTGRWEAVFTDDEGVVVTAVAELDQQGSLVVGTILTPTGDYRYLEGEVDGSLLKLSTFDGAHAFVFTAEVNTDGKLLGDFWSGTQWHESWVAHRNFDARLPDSYSLTYLKEGYDSLEFSFPDLDGKATSLSDDKYRDKVVLVTLSGSWCPNCADESAFLSQYFTQNRDRGLEIITLLYEHFEDFERSAAQGKALRERYGIDYDLLVAGTSDKTQAAETLPMLNHVLAFPTMLFIDREGNVRRIHTGFSGPGTGSYYTDFVNEFNLLMDELLAESEA
jgi:peroxiredoxin